MTGFGDSVARLAAAMNGEDDTQGDWADRSADLVAEIQAEQEEHYLAKLGRWERNRPARERAEQAWRAASERRRAELGAGPEPYQIAAAFDWLRPEAPPHMR